MYRFKTADIDKIQEYISSQADRYKNEFNVSSLAQEIITDHLDEHQVYSIYQSEPL